MNDVEKRELGRISEMALRGLEATLWKRSCETMREAERQYDEGELSDARAHEMLVALIEQRKLVESLRAQIDEGVRANARIQAAVTREASLAALNGRTGNRFVRSRASTPPPADAAS